MGRGNIYGMIDYMTEKQIENALRDRVRAAGGLALKWVSPGCAGVPDRIVILPGGRIHFIELKAPGVSPRPLQLHIMAKLRALGCSCLVIDTLAGIEAFMLQW